MDHSSHPQVRFILSSIRDAFVELQPDEMSLDLAASSILSSQLRQQATTVHSLINATAIHRAAIDRALTDLTLCEDALSAANERHTAALASLQHATAAASLNAADGSPHDAALAGVTPRIESAQLSAAEKTQ